MANSLDLKKAKAELLGVSHAKANLEIRIEEMQEEIKRLTAHIQVQVDREEVLKIKISELESELKK